MDNLQSVLYAPFLQTIQSNPTLRCLVENARPGVGWQVVRMAPYTPVIKGLWKHAGLHIEFQLPGKSPMRSQTRRISLFRVGRRESSIGCFLYSFENNVVFGAAPPLETVDSSMHPEATETYVIACAVFSNAARLNNMIFDPLTGTFLQMQQ